MLQYLTDCPTSSFTKRATSAQALFPSRLNEYNHLEGENGNSPHENRGSNAPKDLNVNPFASATLAVRSDLDFNSRYRSISTATTIDEMLSETSAEFGPAFPCELLPQRRFTSTHL